MQWKWDCCLWGKTNFRQAHGALRVRHDAKRILKLKSDHDKALKMRDEIVHFFQSMGLISINQFHLFKLMDVISFITYTLKKHDLMKCYWLLSSVWSHSSQHWRLKIQTCIKFLFVFVCICGFLAAQCPSLITAAQQLQPSRAATRFRPAFERSTTWSSSTHPREDTRSLYHSANRWEGCCCSGPTTENLWLLPHQRGYSPKI